MRRKHTDNARRYRADHLGELNPLVRASDRTQARLKNLLVTLAIIMIPISAWLGMSTLSAQQQQVTAQQFDRHSVTATTTGEAQMAPTVVQSDFAGSSEVPADATWTFDGVDHQGQVTVSVGAPAGTTTDIWVDNTGARSTAPITGADATAAALFAGVGTLSAVLLLLYGVYSIGRVRLDIRRDAEWDRAIENFLDENSPR